MKEIENSERWTTTLFERLDEAVNMRDTLSDLIILLGVFLEYGEDYKGVTFFDVKGVMRETIWRQSPTLFAKHRAAEDVGNIFGWCKLITLENVPEDTASLYIENRHEADTEYWRVIFFIKKKDLLRVKEVWPNVLLM